MKKKIEILINKLNSGLIERDEQIKIAILSILSKENILFIGPPGTGKSQMTRRLANIIKDGDYFEYLLTKFTTPEEIFGPISIKELENDRFHRNTLSYLTDSTIVFLDEIFKANSAILNSLLTIMNEKLFHNGYKKEIVKTSSILAASNELPNHESELEALYDRFLFRNEISYVSNIKDLLAINSSEPIISEDEKIFLEEIEELLVLSEKIDFPEKTLDKFIAIRDRIFSELGFRISDRRMVKAVKVLKNSAFLSQRNEINDFDLLLLNYIFWADLGSINKINQIIKTVILDIESLNTGEFSFIYEKWNKHFNNFFSEHKKDENGDLLYYDLNSQVVKDSRGPIHLRDAIGNYIFFKGHRDYVKVSNELGKFDHGYIDSGIRTLDKKNVWIYEFSPVEVITDFEKELIGYEKLTLEGNLEPVLIENFLEYYKIYEKSKEEYKEVFTNILRNVKYEYERLEKIYIELHEKKRYLLSQSSDYLWIPQKNIDEINNEIKERFDETFNLISNYKTLIRDLEKAIYG